MSKRTNNKDQLKFVTEKQVGETGFRHMYKLKTTQDGKSVTKKEQQQRGTEVDRFRPKSMRFQLRTGSERTTPGFILVKRKKSKPSATRKEMKKPPPKKRKFQRSEFESKLVTSHDTANSSNGKNQQEIQGQRHNLHQKYICFLN